MGAAAGFIPMIAGTIFSAVLSNAMSKKGDSSPAPAPVVTPPPVMPTVDDKAVEAAKRRSIAASVARRGRASTMLTDPVTGGSDTLGG